MPQLDYDAPPVKFPIDDWLRAFLFTVIRRRGNERPWWTRNGRVYSQEFAIRLSRGEVVWAGKK